MDRGRCRRSSVSKEYWILDLEGLTIGTILLDTEAPIPAYALPR